MTEEEALFPVVPSARLRRGDRVRIQTIWGTELCEVVRVTADVDHFPMVLLRTSSGDRVSINIARVEVD